MKATTHQSASPRDLRVMPDPDMPDEIDFSSGLRGPKGQAILVRLARYARALRAIRDTGGVEHNPLRAAHEMQTRARRALAGTKDPANL